MKRIRSSIRFFALLLLVLTLHILVQGLSLPKFELTPLHGQDICTASLVSDDSAEQTHVGDFKPPKHSFIDYATQFSPDYHIPAYNPNIIKFLTNEPFRAIQQVYLEISVPPDNRV